jgi:NAD(P)H-hydrate epimerase
VDASGLFHLSKRLDSLRGKPCVVTPHAGEFARLSGLGTIAPGTRVERIREFVDRTGITTLLKGSDTLIYDGTTIHINPTGTSALATAGTGDVLTGIIATLLSQGLSPVDAARAGAYWHGLAGQYAAQQRRVGVVAGDVIEALGAALPR